MNAPENTVFTPITDEFSLIRRLTERFIPQNPDLIQGVGDDCAVWRKTDELYWLISTDLMAQDVHFDLSYAPLRYVGYKAAVTNFSDVYAMNGRPRAITVALALDKRASVEAAEALYLGIAEACREHGVELIGGDTSTTRGGLFISITVFGEQAPDKITYRSGAQVNDIICVSGDLGAACAGLRVLEREKAVFLSNPEIQPDLARFEYVAERQLRPRARKDVIDALETAGIVPTAMLDVSDGLAADLKHLCAASEVGALIFQNKIPIDFQTLRVAEDFLATSLEYALYGGEDYELLFTIAQKDFEKIQTLDEFITPIGFIRKDLVQIEFADGSVADLEPIGWNHFGEE